MLWHLSLHSISFHQCFCVLISNTSTNYSYFDTFTSARNFSVYSTWKITSSWRYRLPLIRYNLEVILKFGLNLINISFITFFYHDPVAINEMLLVFVGHFFNENESGWTKLSYLVWNFRVGPSGTVRVAACNRVSLIAKPTHV